MNITPTVTGESGPGTDGTSPVPTSWTPPRFNNETCCLPGMSCWSDDVGMAANKQRIENELKDMQSELKKAESIFNELEAEK